MIHIDKKHDGLYSSEYGYLMLNKKEHKYVFIPYEKQYDEQQLLNIINTLNTLNHDYNKEKNL